MLKFKQNKKTHHIFEIMSDSLLWLSVFIWLFNYAHILQYFSQYKSKNCFSFHVESKTLEFVWFKLILFFIISSNFSMLPQFFEPRFSLNVQNEIRSSNNCESITFIRKFKSEKIHIYGELRIKWSELLRLFINTLNLSFPELFHIVKFITITTCIFVMGIQICMLLSHD